jgi:hypothetical protein
VSSTRQKPQDLPPFVAPKVAAEIESWLRHLGDERRFSPKTLEAYRRDVLQFLAFLAEHLGGAPSLKELAALAPADVRAFMAARRAEGIGSRSLMRTLAGVRGFARFLERNGKGKVGHFTGWYFFDAKPCTIRTGNFGGRISRFLGGFRGNFGIVQAFANENELPEEKGKLTARYNDQPERKESYGLMR